MACADHSVDMIGSNIDLAQEPALECAMFLNGPKHAVTHGGRQYQRREFELRVAARVQGFVRHEKAAFKRCAFAVDGAALIAVEPVAVGSKREKIPKWQVEHQQENTTARAFRLGL